MPSPKPSPPKPRAPKVKSLSAPPAETVAEPTRPVLLESATYRNAQEKTLSETVGKIDQIDSAEIQADADCENAVRRLQADREAVRSAQAGRRADLQRIHDGCVAALNASEPKAAEGSQQ